MLTVMYCRKQRHAAFAVLLFLCAFFVFAPSGPARAGELPEAVKHILVQSITMDGGQHFAATVKMAGEAVPAAREEILFLMVLYAPHRIAETKTVLSLETPVVAAGPYEESAAAPPAKETALPSTGKEEETVGFFSTRNLTGKLEIGGAVNTGNTDDESLAVSVGLNRKDGPWTYDFKSSFDIQRRDNETTQQRVTTDAAVSYDIAPRLYTYGAVQYEDDEFSGFNYRITSGAGLGYRVFVRPKLNWSVEAGPGVRIDSLEGRGNTSVTPALRVFSDFAWDFSPYASFLHNIETIQDGGLTVDTTAAIVARITERVSGKLSYQMRFNGDAPTGSEEIDTATRLSLVYDF